MANLLSTFTSFVLLVISVEDCIVIKSRLERYLHIECKYPCTLFNRANVGNI